MQVQQLDGTWHVLRQNFTESAYTFEAILRPTLKQMNECANSQAPNTTVPNVYLYILLKERCVKNTITPNNTDGSTVVAMCVTSWENNADDFGMELNFLHLDSGRAFLKNLSLFKKNVKILLKETDVHLDELLTDAFR